MSSNNKQISNDKKFEELILYIAKRSEGDAPFGAVKLNKLLFYSDFLAYREFGKSITGHAYQRLPNGPAPQALVPIRKRMAGRGDIAIANRDFCGLRQKRVIALREPDLGEFSAEEVALVNELLDRWKGKTATEIKDKSHKFVGWKLAQEGETIPYTVALVHQRKAPSFLLEADESLAKAAKECLSRGNT